MNAYPHDTSREAAAIQIEIYRQMPPDQRLDLACRMSDAARELSEAGVRSRHSDYTDREVRLAVIRMMLGDELFQKAYPGIDVQP